MNEPMLNFVNVQTWARGAQIGQRLVYARRTPSMSGWPPNLLTAYNSHQMGLVFLAQRRDGRDIVYEATRISLATAKILKIGEY